MSITFLSHSKDSEENENEKLENKSEKIVMEANECTKTMNVFLAMKNENR